MAVLGFAVHAEPAPRTFSKCRERALLDREGTYASSYYGRALGPCQPLEQELDARLETFVALEENVLAFAGYQPVDEAKGPPAPVVFLVRLAPDGRLSESRVIGRLPRPEGPGEMKVLALTSYRGSKKLFAQAQLSSLGANGEGKVENQFWMLDLAGPAKVQKVPSDGTSRTFYPTAAGNLMLVQQSGGGEEGARPTYRLIQVSAAGGQAKPIVALLDESADVVDGEPLLFLRTPSGGKLFDLVKEILVDLKGIPPDVYSMRGLGNRELFFLGVDESARGARVNPRCKPLALYRLPSPWTAPPTKVTGGIGSYNSIMMFRREGRIDIAKNIRSPWIAIINELKYRKDSELEKEEDESDREVPCAEDVAKFPFGRQADLVSYLVGPGKLEEHGCRQAPLLEGPDARAAQELGTWPTSYTEPCTSIEPVQKRMASIKVPELDGCAPLERRIDHCLRSLEVGDLPAFAECRGSDRAIPDLGTSTGLYFAWLAPLRIWALREFAANPALKPQITSAKGSTLVRFTASNGRSALEMEFKKTECEWALEQAQIAPR